MSLTQIVRLVFPHYQPDLYSTYIPIALLVVPWLLVAIIRSHLWGWRRVCWRLHREELLLVLVAGGWFIPIQVPDLPIAASDSVLIHFMGGMVVAPSLVTYMLIAIGQWSQSLAWQAASWFIGAQLMGLANEVFEQVLVRSLHHQINLSDTWWDLGSNTAGVVTAILLLIFVSRILLPIATSWIRRLKQPTA